MGCEENTAHGQRPDDRASCNHVRIVTDDHGKRVCWWCRLPETEFDFDPADHPDAGGESNL